jgi:hypothetical protein
MLLYDVNVELPFKNLYIHAYDDGVVVYSFRFLHDLLR